MGRFRVIRTFDDVQRELDYSSKLSRNARLIERLMEHGVDQVQAFISGLEQTGMTPLEVLRHITE